jgi:hypothetical protein
LPQVVTQSQHNRRHTPAPHRTTKGNLHPLQPGKPQTNNPRQGMDTSIQSLRLPTTSCRSLAAPPRLFRKSNRRFQRPRKPPRSFYRSMGKVQQMAKAPSHKRSNPRLGILQKTHPTNTNPPQSILIKSPSISHQSHSISHQSHINHIFNF